MPLCVCVSVCVCLTCVNLCVLACVSVIYNFYTLEREKKEGVGGGGVLICRVKAQQGWTIGSRQRWKERQRGERQGRQATRLFPTAVVQRQTEGLRLGPNVTCFAVLRGGYSCEQNVEKVPSWFGAPISLTVTNWP